MDCDLEMSINFLIETLHPYASDVCVSASYDQGPGSRYNFDVQNSHGLTAKPLAQDSPRLSVRANRHVTRGQLEKTVIV